MSALGHDLVMAAIWMVVVMVIVAAAVYAISTETARFERELLRSERERTKP
jgi:hypothetical protein